MRRAVLAEIEDLAERGAAYYRSHPLEDPPPLERRLLNTLSVGPV